MKWGDRGAVPPLSKTSNCRMYCLYCERGIKICDQHYYQCKCPVIAAMNSDVVCPFHIMVVIELQTGYCKHLYSGFY